MPNVLRPPPCLHSMANLSFLDALIANRLLTSTGILPPQPAAHAHPCVGVSQSLASTMPGTQPEGGCCYPCHLIQNLSSPNFITVPLTPITARMTSPPNTGTSTSHPPTPGQTGYCLLSELHSFYLLSLFLYSKPYHLLSIKI